MNTPHISIELVNHTAKVDAFAETPDELSELCSMLLCGLATGADNPVEWLMTVTMNAAASLDALEEDTHDED